jgi:hypothetical protein
VAFGGDSAFSEYPFAAQAAGQQLTRTTSDDATVSDSVARSVVLARTTSDAVGSIAAVPANATIIMGAAGWITSGTGNSHPIVMTIPAGARVNDRVYMAFGENGGVAIPVPTGWRPILVPAAYNGNILSCAIFERDALLGVGEAGSTVTVDIGQSRVQIGVIFTSDGDLDAVSAVSNQTSLQSTNTVPAVTPVTDNALLLEIAFLVSTTNAQTYTSTPPTGYSTLFDQCTSNAGANKNIEIFIASKQLSGQKTISQGPTFSTPSVQTESVVVSLTLTQAAKERAVANVGRFASTSDNATVSETAVRSAEVYARTTADSVPVSESLARTAQVFSRTTSDSVVVSEALSSHVTVARTTADSVVVSEAAVRSADNYSRTASETATVSETVARSLLQARAPSDAVSVSDTTTRVVAQSRTTSDNATVSDVASGVIGGNLHLTRTASDSISTSESVARIVVLPRAVAASVPVSESLARTAQVFARSTSDSVAVVESATRSAEVFARTSSDSVPVSDANARSQHDFRSTGESVPVSEAATRASQAFARTTADTAVGAASVSSHTAASRTTSDSFAVGTSTPTPVYVPSIKDPEIEEAGALVGVTTTGVVLGVTTTSVLLASPTLGADIDPIDTMTR